MNGQLLLGFPIKIDFFYFQPLKLKEIILLDEDYILSLGIFFLTNKDLGFEDESFNHFSTFDLIRARSYYSEDFKNEILKALKIFTKENFSFIGENFFLKENILLTEHWEQISHLLAEENFIDLESLEKKPEKELSEKAKEIKRKIEENKKLISQYKKQKETNSDLFFLMNAFCTKSPNISILQIGDLTLYQFKNQLDQLMKNESYDFNIKSILAGADPKKIKMVHWTENK